VQWFRGIITSASLALLLFVSMPGGSLADEILYSDNNSRLTTGLEVGAYYGRTNHANFGAGVFDFRTGEQRSSQVDAYEGYLKPVFEGHTGTARNGTFYSRVSAVAAISRPGSPAATKKISTAKKSWPGGGRQTCSVISAKMPSTYRSAPRNSGSAMGSLSGTAITMRSETAHTGSAHAMRSPKAR
jgi:hypothetical protein